MLCANLDLNGLQLDPRLAGEQCFACSLTRTRPDDDDLEGLPQYYRAERPSAACSRARRARLCRRAAHDATGDGITFDLLSSVAENVVIGHADGVITIDLAEGDDVHREKVRIKLGEAYRTLLGHFRHEVGHYVEGTVTTGRLLDRSRVLFGDETR